MKLITDKFGPIREQFFYSEIQGSAINSEKLWNDWFTVNSYTVTKFNALSENETTPQETPQAMKLPLVLDLVLKAENERYVKQAKK